MLRRKHIRWATALAVVVLVAAVSFVMYRDRAPARSARGGSTSSLLALTWGPSLCTVEPRTSGCRSGHVGRLGPVFVLHGLWPQPSSEQYCDVTRDQRATKPPPALPDDLRRTLQTRMSDASVMAPHEWYAHGSCSGVGAPEYFRLAADLTDQATAVLNPVFAGARGRQITRRMVQDAVEARFGTGSARRVALSCRDGGGDAVLYEVRLSLPPVAELQRRSGPVALRDALAAGPAVAPGCGRGVVP